MSFDGGRELGWPGDQGRQARTGRQADPKEADPVEVAPLDDGVGEVGGTDDHRVDVAVADAGQGLGHPADDVVGRRGLEGLEDRLALHHGGVGVGAADVDADSSWSVHGQGSTGSRS